MRAVKEDACYYTVLKFHKKNIAQSMAESIYQAVENQVTKPEALHKSK